MGALLQSVLPGICLVLRDNFYLQGMLDALAHLDSSLEFLRRGRKPSYFLIPDRHSIKHLDATQLDHVMAEP
jgi:hypothetical protein